MTSKTGHCCNSYRACRRFVYVNVVDGYNFAIAEAKTTMAEGLGWPTQGHIGLTGNPDEILVTYVTGTLNTPMVKFV